MQTRVPSSSACGRWPASRRATYLTQWAAAGPPFTPTLPGRYQALSTQRTLRGPSYCSKARRRSPCSTTQGRRCSSASSLRSCATPPPSLSRHPYPSSSLPVAWWPSTPLPASSTPSPTPRSGPATCCRCLSPRALPSAPSPSASPCSLRACCSWPSSRSATQSSPAPSGAQPRRRGGRSWPSWAACTSTAWRGCSCPRRHPMRTRSSQPATTPASGGRCRQTRTPPNGWITKAHSKKA
mmetsp:Transcript_68932/g.166660  ORF Transcript_68932/g.166660 Transcript_68932/m.166660 type:complete len:239 (+) Transcript_68932:395-1111(+)